MWNDKYYHSLDYDLKAAYGGKVYKLALSSGCSCPNRDGKVSTGGCIFCSEYGSGEFSATGEDIAKQIENAKAWVLPKLKSAPVGYIAYFQSFSNTYGDPNRLSGIFHAAITHPEILILSIATRPDCLSDEMIDILKVLNNIKPVWIELGLQTSNDKVAGFINRGYKTCVFEEAVRKLNEAGIKVITHVIIGLPFEEPAETAQTVMYLCDLHEKRGNSQTRISGIKLHLMYVLKGTRLCELYEKGEAHLHNYTLDEYADTVTGLIAMLPEDITVHRISGDAPKARLLSPLWSADKKNVLNTINKRFMERGIWQGCLRRHKTYIH